MSPHNLTSATGQVSDVNTVTGMGKGNRTSAPPLTQTLYWDPNQNLGGSHRYLQKWIQISHALEEWQEIQKPLVADAAKKQAPSTRYATRYIVDVVGGRLLYKLQSFYFTSPQVMLNYLWVMNPSQKNNLRRIHLAFRLTSNKRTIESRPLVALAELPGL